MKKYLLIFAVLLCCSMYVRAAELVKGKILTDKDTLDVTFKIPVFAITGDVNYIKLQEKVKYLDASGNQCVLKPGQAVEIQFTFRGSKIRMLSRFKSIYLGSMFSSNEYIFLQLLVDGGVRLLGHYRRQSSGGMYNGATGMYTGGGSYVANDYILQKGNGNLVQVYGGSFRNEMAEYFSQCPELVEMIRNKTYRIRDMEAIVKYYNTSCK
ncbi:MAG: hypothetical protein ACTHJT_12780 [Cytophaga sp.]|uniref:hypothetical protein n=1 Tax=Cytophaga sp. TaxID=29535 RepID=UPI003F7DF507